MDRNAEQGQSKEEISLTQSQEKTSSEDIPRDTWQGRFDVIVACCGFGIGLGNVWKFPFLCYKNGGGAFLIPYFICCIVGGVPTYFLELSLGQFMAKGGMRTWDICPLFQGIGLASATVLFFVTCDYIVIMAWALYYLFSSFTSTLPWTSCDNDWNTVYCSVTNVSKMLTNVTYVTSNQTIYSNTSRNLTSLEFISKVTNDPITEFWERKVLGITNSIAEVGVVKWDLCLCLVFAWILVYACIWKGIRSSGKVMYFTVSAPYLFMFILLIRGATLDGALDGIKYYLLPDFQKLLEVQVWADAGNQVFYSYAVGLGVVTAIGSYNKFHGNSYRDCIIFAFMNSFTSLLSGFVIFTVLGFMAKRQGVSIDDVAESGPGLAFIVYPEAVAQLPLAPMWSAFFFCMVIFLGIDSQFVQVEGFVTLFFDLYPKFFSLGYRKRVFTGLTCIVCLLIGLSMVTEESTKKIVTGITKHAFLSPIKQASFRYQPFGTSLGLFRTLGSTSGGGMYVFQLIDYYSVNKTMLLIALSELLVISYAYGINRYMDDLELMYGRKVFIGFKLCWAFLSPLFVMCLLVFGITFYSELSYDRKFYTYNYPPWAIGVGWILTASSVICIPLVAVYKLAMAQGTMIERLRETTTPNLKKHQLGLTERGNSTSYRE